MATKPRLRNTMPSLHRVRKSNQVTAVLGLASWLRTDSEALSLLSLDRYYAESPCLPPAS